MSAAFMLEACRLRQGTKMGAWITVLPLPVNGMELGDQEYCDAIFLIWGIDPPYFLPQCDGCNATFSICHVLYFKKGCIITTRHNELCGGVSDLAEKCFTPSHVHDNSLTHQGN